MVKKIEISIEYAKNIHKVLEDHVSMGFEIVSQEIKEVVSEEVYKKLQDIFYKYHNANCGPFNRTLKRLIEEVEVKPNSSHKREQKLLSVECEFTTLDNGRIVCKTHQNQALIYLFASGKKVCSDGEDILIAKHGGFYNYIKLMGWYK